MPDELTTLFEWIESINKALLLAVLTVVLFVAAPRSDAALVSGQQELEALLSVKDELNKAVASETGPPTESAVVKALSPDSKAQSPALDRADLDALGLAPISTVGGLLDTLEGRTSRCEPMPDSEVMEGFRALHGKAGSFEIESVVFESTLTDDFALACTATLSAAKDTARAARAVPPEPAEPLKKPSPHRATTEDQTAMVGGKPVTVATAQDLQLRAFRDAGAIQDKYDGLRRAFDTATGVLRASTVALIDSVGTLRRSLTVQAGEHTAKAPRFVVATVKHKTPGVPADLFAVPLPCNPVPVLSSALVSGLLGKARPAGADPKLPLLLSLRTSDSWERIQAAEPAEARTILQQAIAKEKGKLDIFGLSVHEDLLGTGLPWLLALAVAFQLVHVFRLRELSTDKDYAEHIRAAAKALPTLPTPNNWPSGVLVYGSVLASMVTVLVLQFSGGVIQLIGCLAAASVSFTGLALSILQPKAK